MVIEEIMLGASIGTIAVSLYAFGEKESEAKINKVRQKYKKEFFNVAFQTYNTEAKRKSLLGLYSREIEELNGLKHLFPKARKDRNNIIRALKSMKGYEKEVQAYLCLEH